MNIVIEGPDGSGKTTIAKLVAERLGHTYIRCPGSTQLGEMLRPTLKNCADMDPIVKCLLFAAVDYDAIVKHEFDDTVFDRSGISGIVYRSAAGESKCVDILRDMIRRDVRFLYGSMAKVIRLDAPDEVLDDRIGSRENDTDEGSRMAHAVRYLYRLMPESVPAIDTHEFSVEKSADLIVDICRNVDFHPVIKTLGLWVRGI